MGVYFTVTSEKGGKERMKKFAGVTIICGVFSILIVGMGYAFQHDYGVSLIAGIGITMGSFTVAAIGAIALILGIKLTE